MNVLEPKVEIATEKLIQAVKKRPALYSKENPSYHHHHGKYKGQLWKEVCNEVFTDWCNFSPLKKVEYAHDLQRRWKNLRTCFTRELAQQRKELKRAENSGEPDLKRRRKYVYFDQLSFLMNPDDNPEASEVKVSMEEDSNDPLETEMFNLESEESAYEESSSRCLSSQQYVQIDEEPFQPNMYERNERMKPEVSQNEEDEDRQFVLSIVPALRKLNDKQKFDAKIEILKVLKKISTGDDS